MYKIAILTGFVEFYKSNPSYHKHYKLLDDIFMKHGIIAKRVSYEHMKEVGDKVIFQKTAMIEGDGFVVVDEDFVPDLVWNRISESKWYLSEKLSNFPTSPSFRLHCITTDKYQTYQYLPEYQPYTQLLYKFLGYSSEQKKFGNNLVVKPINAYGGSGIHFMTKKELFEKKGLFEGMTKQYIVQEYKDFSKGAPGISVGNHDVRLVYLSKKFAYAALRTPAEGSLKSNVSTGGSIKYLCAEHLPKDLLTIAENIQQKLKIEKSDYYCLDFGYCVDDEKWYLIEINSSPGYTFTEKYKKEQEIYFNDLAKYFLSLRK